MNAGYAYHALREGDRVRFVETRDGVAGAVEWATMVYTIYRKNLRTGYGKEFRRTLIASCAVLRRYVRRNRNRNPNPV